MVLYEDAGDLVQKLTRLITHYAEFKTLRGQLSAHMGKFAWQNRIDRYDEELEKLVNLPDGFNSNNTYPSTPKSIAQFYIQVRKTSQGGEDIVIKKIQFFRWRI